MLGIAMRRLLAPKHFRSAVAAIAILLAGLLVAQAELATDCFSDDNERRISGCTTIIEGSGFTPADKSQAYAMRALALSLKGLYPRAIDDYDAAIRLVPDFAVALNNRAWAYFKWGQGPKGLPDVEKSMQLNPMSEHTWDTRAHIRQVMGRHEDAFQDYEQAVNLGGERMIKLYQCGLSERGLYKGRMDGIYSEETRTALRTCSQSRTCDPLPGDEMCRDTTS